MISSPNRQITRRDWDALRRDLAGRAESALSSPCSDDPFGAALLVHVCGLMGHRGAHLRAACTEIVDWVAHHAQAPQDSWSDRDVGTLLFLRAYLPRVWAQCDKSITTEFDASISSLVGTNGSVCDRPLCSALAWCNLDETPSEPARDRLARYLQELLKTPAYVLNDRSAAIGVALLLRAKDGWALDAAMPHINGIMALLEEGACSLRRELPLAYTAAQCRRRTARPLQRRIRQACGDVLRTFLAEQHTGDICDGDAALPEPRSLSRTDLALAYALTSEYSDDVVTASAWELECPLAVRVMAALSGLLLCALGTLIVWLGWRMQLLRPINWADLSVLPWYSQVAHVASTLASNAVVASVASLSWVLGVTLVISTTWHGRSHQVQLIADVRKAAIVIVMAIVTSLIASLLMTTAQPVK